MEERGMVVVDSNVGTGLVGFLERYGNTRAKGELLLFWALHPDTHFSRLAVLCATECSKVDVAKALDSMTSDNLVDMRSGNGLTTYSLTSDESIRQMVALLGALDWRQRHILFARTHQVPGA